jgi:hypothetical protein
VGKFAILYSKVGGKRPGLLLFLFPAGTWHASENIVWQYDRAPLQACSGGRWVDYIALDSGEFIEGVDEVLPKSSNGVKADSVDYKKLSKLILKGDYGDRTKLLIAQPAELEEVVRSSGFQTPILVKGAGAEGLRDLGIRYVNGPTSFFFALFQEYIGLWLSLLLFARGTRGKLTRVARMYAWRGDRLSCRNGFRALHHCVFLLLV